MGLNKKNKSGACVVGLKQLAEIAPSIFFKLHRHNEMHINAPINYFSFYFMSPDERQDVQQKTFTKWINHHLHKSGYEPIKDLFVDLRDGHKLLELLESLTDQKYVGVLARCPFNVNKLIN